MNWLVPLVLLLSVTPVVGLAWWWLRSKQAERRKAEAVARMTDYVRARQEDRRELVLSGSGSGESGGAEGSFSGRL